MCEPQLLKLITLGYVEQHLYVISIKHNKHNRHNRHNRHNKNNMHNKHNKKGVWFQRQEISEARLLYLPGPSIPFQSAREIRQDRG